MLSHSLQEGIPLNDLLEENYKLYIENLQDKNHAAFFVKSEKTQFLNLRFFNIITMDLIAYNCSFIIKEGIFYRYSLEDDRCYALEGFLGIYEILEKETKKANNFLSGYVNQIEELEDTLYSRKISPTFMDYWFSIKRDISKIERIFARSIYILNQFLKANTQNENFPQKEFQDLYEELEHYQRICVQNLGKLDTLYNYHNSLKSDKMNSNIYVLTLLSGIFLPLNLLVGFFGMNTQQMYFHENPNGTLIVTYILGALFIILALGLPLAKKIEVFIIRKFLGRYGFYKAIQKHIQNITRLEP